MITTNYCIFGMGGASGLILDDTPMAKIAFSLRKVRTAYTGNCIKVRRSSDNTEQDFGFVDGVLDTVSLLSFVGGGNGFVTKWYDQSGSGNDAYQSTQANQPLIVESGTITTDNGKPTVKHTTSHWLQFPSFALPQCSIYTVHAFKVGSPVYCGLLTVAPASGRGFMLVNDFGWSANGVDTIVFFNNGSSVDNHNTGKLPQNSLPTPYRSLIWHNNGDISNHGGYASGSESFTQGVSYNEGYGYFGAWGSYSISGTNRGYGGGGGNVTIGEILVWDTDERGNNNKIMQDLRQFYSLY